MLPTLNPLGVPRSVREWKNGMFGVGLCQVRLDFQSCLPFDIVKNYFFHRCGIRSSDLLSFYVLFVSLKQPLQKPFKMSSISSYVIQIKIWSSNLDRPFAQFSLKIFACFLNIFWKPGIILVSVNPSIHSELKINSAFLRKISYRLANLQLSTNRKRNKYLSFQKPFPERRKNH